MATNKPEGPLILTQLTRPAKNQSNPISPPLIVKENHSGFSEGYFRSIFQGIVENVPDIEVSLTVTKDSPFISGEINKLQIGNILKKDDKIIGKVIEIAIDKTSAVLENPISLESGDISVTVSPGRKVIELIVIETKITPRDQLLISEIKATFPNGETKIIVSNLDIDKLYTENQIERV